ncbi:MAG: hypothetical protein FD138_2904 [Planctomycetota bacterium]|nr:MAG: hypothetical protein FD138_2904 [Planctomycetota bacterium]
MPRLFVGNFDFEQELSCEASRTPSPSLRRMSAERAVAWISLAEDGDWIWTPDSIAEDFWESLAQQGLPRVRGVTDWKLVTATTTEIVAWGWVPWTRKIDLATARPSELAVKQANSREWSFHLEQQLRVALPGAARLERIEELAETVRRSASEFGEPIAEHGWVIKANFGMAARERLLGRGSTLTSAQQNWLCRRLAAEGAVYFEPWLRRRAEVGIQWTMPPFGQGEPKLEGMTPLLCDSQGGYRGSEFSLDTSIPREWQRAVEVCEQAAKRLQSLGYFGPLGIDAAIYEDSAGNAISRPLQDVNARFTMGRLALGFRRLLRDGERGEWQHRRVTELNPTATEVLAREIDLTPRFVGDKPPTHGSRLRIR